MWLGSALEAPSWADLGRKAQEEIIKDWGGPDAVVVLEICGSAFMHPNAKSICGELREIDRNSTFAIKVDASAIVRTGMATFKEMERAISVLNKHGVAFEVVYGAFAESR